MCFSEEFKDSLAEINEKTFNDSSLAAFNYQYHHCEIYQEYCKYLNIAPDSIQTTSEIPFLPIEFFKNHAIKSGNWSESKIFKSSGTTDTGRSHHYVKDESLYHSLSRSLFESIFGPLSDLQIIAILPSYQEQGDSSLISMVDYFIRFGKQGSGYYLNDNVKTILETDKKKIVFGVSYALLDLARVGIRTVNTKIIETGGMKGRRKEMTRKELHTELTEGFGVDEIWSEYGMTELMSQGYGPNGSFVFPPWAKCMIRDINDPFSYVETGRSGGINVIDLANIDSCCFIETKDLGRVSGESFEVLGRFDNSDIRGCNLMV
ncbi:Acyl-protein synthetase, LuxE [Ekhidna lutea]|uniref:Acyl-protein synthetase, LuxE n=1 Tax=Ekhidna lutea TaxID=447679 RepID=A0A239HIC0_EKHLU|nr:hypothetical protein [Ekhidna lutea]SNS80905.1 Acyl-protein synthetase, LuxE [Ekhidna lutea]